MEKTCTECGKAFTSPSWNAKYCSHQCYQASASARDKVANPDTLKGKSPATTGAISELRVAVDLMAKGYDVFRALSPNCPCDLAILRNGTLLKIEVRTTFVSYTGKLYTTRSKKDDSNNIDHFARVLPDKIIYEPELE